MKLLNISFKTLLIIGSTVLAFSCKKPGISEISDAGQTLVKFPRSDFQLVSLNLLTSPQSFEVDFRRDVPNEEEINKSLTATVMLDPTVISDYNTAHGTSYIALPAGNFNVDASTPASGNTITMSFAPGEFAKPIKINVPNASTLDPNRRYALGFKIASVTGAKISALNTILVEVGLKNQWDGDYSVVSGTVTRYTAPGVPANDALSGSLAGNPDVTLTTTGPNTVEITGLQWAAQGGGVGGINNLRATVDPATNLVTMSSLGAPSLTNWAGHENKYDPATKTFYLAFRWNPTT
jgi:hypothetical protein